jgi:hypothetical protein
MHTEEEEGKVVVEKKRLLFADLVMQVVLIFSVVLIYYFGMLLLALWQVLSSLSRTIRLWRNLYFQKLLRRYWVLVLLSAVGLLVAGHRDRDWPDPYTVTAIVLPMVAYIYYIFITIRLIQFSYYQINPAKTDKVNEMITIKGIRNWEKYLHYFIITISTVLIGYFVVLEFWYNDY